jgi:branched-chain amino acid aminotransferase
MNGFTWYVNGTFLPAQDATVAPNDLGFVRGYGVFDFLRTYGRAPFRLAPHLDRLSRSAEQIDLPLPMTQAEIEQIVFETLARNPDATDMSIKIIVTGGFSPGGLMPDGESSLLVLIGAIAPVKPEWMEQGASLVSVDYERFMPGVKSLNYITALRALKRARAAGAAEALYRTADAHVTECTTSNFFAFKDGVLITADTDILEGVTRAATLDAAEDLAPIEYRRLAYSELATVDEAFITSTTKEILPIVRVDDIVIGDGTVGKQTQRLMASLHALIQQETATPVPAA